MVQLLKPNKGIFYIYLNIYSSRFALHVNADAAVKISNIKFIQTNLPECVFIYRGNVHISDCEIGK